VATRLAAMLERDGYRVAMSRTADTSVAELSANDLVAGALTVAVLVLLLVDMRRGSGAFAPERSSTIER
jgi:N-acetylmuramoyl-L-alanine amidase